jgi:hypothetical protein
MPPVRHVQWGNAHLKHTWKMVLLLGLAAIITSFSLVACGGKKAADASSNQAPAQTEEEAFAEMIANAAAKLEVSVEDLIEALGDPPDLDVAAEKLEMPIGRLRVAMPLLGESRSMGGGSIYAAAAEKLNLTAGDLTEALGMPPSLEDAAKKLDIPLEKMKEALPFLVKE